MRIQKKNAVSVIIDVQTRLFKHIHENDQLSENLVKLILGLKALNISILVTQQYSKGLGPTIEPVSEALGEYTIIEKRSFSCMDESNFKTSVSGMGKKFVIIAGIEAHVCIMQTVVDLLEAGFVPVVVEDCISSRHIKTKDIALERMRHEGAIITSLESILFELCRYSGSDEFKTIARLIK